MTNQLKTTVLSPDSGEYPPADRTFAPGPNCTTLSGTKISDYSRLITLLKQSDYPRCNPAEWNMILRNISTAIAPQSTSRHTTANAPAN
jgi:hypothetical protein